MLFFIIVRDNIVKKEAATQRPRNPRFERTQERAAASTNMRDQHESQQNRSRSRSRYHRKGTNSRDNNRCRVPAEAEPCFLCDNEKRRYHRQGRAWPGGKNCFSCGRTSTSEACPADHPSQPDRRQDFQCRLSDCACCGQYCQHCSKCDLGSFVGDVASLSNKHEYLMRTDTGETLCIASNLSTFNVGLSTITPELLWTGAVQEGRHQPAGQQDIADDLGGGIVSAGDRGSFGKSLSSWFWVPRAGLKP